MGYEEGWDKIDHFIPLNPVQAQPHQPAQSQKQWRSSPPTSPPSFLRPSLRKSFFIIETSVPATVQLPSHQERSKRPGRILRDPNCDVYHSTTDKNNGKDKKTMPTKSKSKSSNAIFKTSAPNQLPVDGKGGLLNIRY